MNGSALHAQGFAFQGVAPVICADGLRRAFRQYETPGIGIVFVGEIHALLALFGCRHRRNNRVNFFAVQRRNQTVPRGLHQLAIALHLRAQRLGNIHIKAIQLALGIDRRKRRIFAFNADAQFVGGKAGTRQGDGCGNHNRFHISSNFIKTYFIVIFYHH